MTKKTKKAKVEKKVEKKVSKPKKPEPAKKQIKSKIRIVAEKPVEKPKEIEEVSLDEKPIRRRRRGRNKKDKIYFSKETEEAIIEYNGETCDIKRNQIYEERIKFSFEKLVENIFNTFKFTYFDNSPLEVQRETVSHLVSNIHKFQAGKGKAFSYFSIVAKNYLIFHNNNNYKRYNQHVSISETPSESEICLQAEDNYHQQVENKELINKLIYYWENNINKVFSKEKDLNIAHAVLELMRNCERLESFNKKTLYLYIREMSFCKTQQVTKVINKMKTHQFNLMKNYIENGTF